MRARMPASALAAAILLVLAPPVAAQVEPVCLPDIEAKTGPPEFNEGFTPLRLRARADYERETSGQRGAALTRVPDDLSAGVRFGRISNCKEIWIVAVDGEGPRHTVIVDVNRNGDLTDDPRKTLEPTRGLFEGFEFHTAVFEGPERRFRISVAGSGPMKGIVGEHALMERRGSIKVGGRAVPFVLEGFCGIYDGEENGVSLDLDGDGQVDTSRASDERFTVEERYVDIGGSSYEFKVAPDGAWLRLTPSDVQLPARASLAVGALAPEFAFVDLEGVTQQLSDYRGRVVLLQAWATWCGPCLKEIPELVELYSRFHERGLEVIGVAKEPGVDGVESFVAEHGMPWPQAVRGSGSPILETYRVEGVPTHVLVDRDGRIAGKNRLVEELTSAVAALLEPPPQESPR